MNIDTSNTPGPLDRYFGTPTTITGRPETGAPDTAGLSAARERAAQIYQAATALKHAALEHLSLTSAASRGKASTQKEQKRASDYLVRCLIMSERELDAAQGNTERNLCEAVRRFREIVPLCPKQNVVHLTRPGANLLSALSMATEMRDAERITESDYLKALTELAARAGLKAGKRARETEKELRRALEGAEECGAPWVFEGQGAESKAFKDDTGCIYKITPRRTNILGIAPITDGSLRLRDNQPPLFDQDGSLPLFDRLVSANSFPCHTPTEMVAVLDDGHFVLKQPYLGRQEPEPSELVEAAIRAGAVVLPPQEEDSRTGGDGNTCPLVFRDHDSFWLVLDFNPRNSRRVGTTAVPFDLVFRKLTENDIHSNHQIREAVQKLSPGRRIIRIQTADRGRIADFDIEGTLDKPGSVSTPTSLPNQ